MKKNEPNPLQTQPADHKDQADQSTQDNPAQDDLSLEDLDQVSGGSITRKIDKSSPIFFSNSLQGTSYKENIN